MITADFAPKVQHDDTLRHPVSPPVDEDLVHRHLVLVLDSGRCLGLYDFYISVVELVWLCYFDWGRIVLWYTTFGHLDEIQSHP